MTRAKKETELLSKAGIVPVKRVEVLRRGNTERPIPMLPTLSSQHVGWNGIAVESFDGVPACVVPEHEHHTHFLNLIRSGRLTCHWRTNGGQTGSAEEGPGTIYILPAGTRDRLTRSGPTNQTMLVMASHFLARTLDETAHLAGIELITHWNLRDRHIVSLMLALNADLEDGSPAGPLYGESLGVALACYLVRRYSVLAPRETKYKGGMPTVRLNRVLDFMRQNYARETRLWELAALAGMSPHYFCELFKKSTGLSPHQYSIRCRVDQAKIYLRSRQFTIRQVAKATGFVDQSHFTKVFRRIVGVTPMRFRRM
jgi:AraC family transcriptional regulator